MMRAMPAVLFLVTALAGCSGAAPAPALSACQGNECEATVTIADAGPTTYPVTGVVVDEAVVPVARATVQLLEGHDPLGEVKTDHNGAFTFNGLSDGFYRLHVSKGGFAPAETQLDLQGEPKRVVRMQVLSVPPEVPIHNIVKWEGIVGYGADVAGFSVFTGTSATVMGETIDNSYRSFYDEVMAAGINPSWAQPEVVWESNQAAGDILRLKVDANSPTADYGYLGWRSGTSPLAFPIDAAMIEEFGLGRATNQSMPRGLALGVGAGSNGLTSYSVVLQQPFTIYLSLLYHITPPEGWMFVTDGELA